MFYPTLSRPTLSENKISAFGGLDRSPVIKENSFSQTKNTSSSKYPALSPRENRLNLCSLPADIRAIDTCSGITYIAGNTLIHNGIIQFNGLSDTPKKQIVNMGGNVIVFPDGYYFNSLKINAHGISTDKGFLSHSFSQPDGLAALLPCIAGEPIPWYSIGRPDSSFDGGMWIDESIRSVSPLYKYSEASEDWFEVTPTHFCISYPNIQYGFSAGDTVRVKIDSLDIDSYFKIAETQNNAIVFDGKLECVHKIIYEQDSSLQITRDIPEMDFVFEHQNRLFGCRYGKNDDGETINEIYASKLGDAKNWHSFNGLSTDSYAASCGSEGEWTGGISHMGYAVFFKENRIHRLFGTKPSNFTLYSDTYTGVAKNCENSLALLNGRLFYHGKDGIYTYSGNTPTLISRRLGSEQYKNAVGAVTNDKYYVSMKDSQNESQTFVYDTFRDIWHREDSSEIKFLSSVAGNVLAVLEDNGDNSLVLLDENNIPDICRSLYGDTMQSEDGFEWEATTGNIGLTDTDQKFLSKIEVKARLDSGAFLIFFYECGDGLWEECARMEGRNKPTSRKIYLYPPRYDSFRLKIVGHGKGEIYSLSKITEERGDVN